MKDLQYHKKQIKQHRMRNIQARADSKIDAIGARVLAASQERWDGMLNELRLQRCKLQEQQMARIYPNLEVRTIMKYYGHHADEVVDWLINGGDIPAILYGKSSLFGI